MVFRLQDQNSVATQFINELRDEKVQVDRMRFRTNLRRLGMILGYELSKYLAYHDVEIETPMGTASSSKIYDNVVITGVLRAGLPMHQGVLDVFDHAESAFVSAYRKHHKDGTFEIALQYVTCPPLDGKVLVIADAMLATGASIESSLSVLREYGTPKAIHIVSAIASTYGVEHLQRLQPNINIWLGAEDDELTGKFYIVPGLGDAGDLAYGPKLQD